ncbi:MAG: nitrate reductase cytochrome c-type subunit [Sulfuricurvum sp.]|jgi:cytochrome c-type protein NapB|uniref:nitrate reductase cytochrome c-type subunit n=1 Tax=Sulfuricurvum sp. TaxID=2025608 RepID=UPI0025F6E5B8|nr:nitrate reductase cytochrome c-type subunit [Sulfuricurvum sp.]MCK9372215.1 nitrate reductase cytochrome c-type subunit [Sulfuricurvum sp.]
MKTKQLIGSLIAASLLVSSVYAVNAEVDETQLGLRKVDIYTEDTALPNGTNYNKEAPGTSKRFDRAYTNAPPMIPHDIDDLGEIDKNNNACLGCHMPNVAGDMGATPIPKSHFTSFRPTVSVDDEDNLKAESDDQIIKKDLKGQLWQGRYNCSACHAPQTKGDLKVENTFKPAYTDKKGQKHKNQSYLLDELDIGVKVGNGL